MCVAAVLALGERGGSSLTSIRRWVLETHAETRSKHPASFNALTLKALGAAVAKGRLEREKHSYKASALLLKQLSKKGGSDRRRLADQDDTEFAGTAAESNRALRKEMLERRGTRDAHLLRHIGLLRPFLQADGNYFDKAASRGEGKEGQEAGTQEEEEEEDEGGDRAMRGVAEYPQPPLLVAELHAHQRTGISWLVHMFRLGMPMILGDQMGLGKTLQTIGLIAALRQEGQRGPCLVVVPLSVLSNWMAEFQRFCPSLRAVRMHGPRSERERIKSDELRDQDFDVVVTTFEMLVSESNFFRRRFVWTLVVVDEGHRLKNDKSQLSDRLRAVPALSRLLLTGTPLQNNLRELWALLHFLAPDVFPRASAERFEDGFDLQRGLIDNATLRRARRMLALFMLRRVKDEVALRLPSRRELTVLVPLTAQQEQWYRHMLCAEEVAALVMDEGAEGRRGEGDYRRLMNLLLQLRKICNHTFLMPAEVLELPRGDALADLVDGSGKLRMLDRMLPLLKQGGHRVLLFSQFTSMLDLLEEYCELRGWTFLVSARIPALHAAHHCTVLQRLDGSTNRVQRRLDVRRFNSAESAVFVFLISTRAGGLGLNLASADTVVLYDSDWNPQVHLTPTLA